MSDDDDRRLCLDIAAAVGRGDDPLPLLMLAVGGEREECAALAERIGELAWEKYKRGPMSDRADPYDEGGSDYADRIAAAIRANRPAPAAGRPTEES